MSRQQLNLLEKAVEDFNKELNPYIKQRKVEIQMMKLKQLLLPSHFISYGRNSAIQRVVQYYEEFKKNPVKFHRTANRQMALNFRNYLITSLVIGNGLRASNIIELRLKDFYDAETVQGYEGHKVITNSKYKTSTIYGEKFIVIPLTLFDHYLFYID